MKKLLLALFLFSSVAGHAQITSSSANTAGSSSDIGGAFYVSDVIGTATHTYNVNYILSPKNVINTINVTLASSFSIPLTGKIVNSSGTTISTWSGTVYNVYRTSFSVTSYPAGAYQLQLFDKSGNKVCTLPFTKS
ncbi:MAG: hypothetical protein H0X33_01590 [Taibaiella sp.]|nr:hypothetical protein [Taibaiella sp.]